MKLIAFSNTERMTIRMNSYGLIVISALFVHSNNLIGKSIMLLKDEEDKERKFLYVNITETPKGMKVKKSKSGSYVIFAKRIANHFLNGKKSERFLFIRKINEKNEPYFIFERETSK